jgi:hypothetical protein
VNALSQFLARRPRGPKHASDEQLAAAITTLPPDHPVHMPLPATAVPPEIRALERAMYPQAPTFTPNARPFPAAAPPVTVAQGSHARTGRQHVPQPQELLQRVLDGIHAIPPKPSAVFAADFRTLPCFRGAARAAGWCALQMGHGYVAHRRDAADAALALGYPGGTL